jgi:hypothetical protein
MEKIRVVEGRAYTIPVCTLLGDEEQEMNNGNEIPLEDIFLLSASAVCV